MITSFLDFLNESSKIIDYYRNNNLMDIDYDVKYPKDFDFKREHTFIHNLGAKLSSYYKYVSDLQKRLFKLKSKYSTHFKPDFLINDFIPFDKYDITKVLTDVGETDYYRNKEFKKDIENVYLKREFEALKKYANERGLTVNATIYAIAWINYFTNMAGNRIDPNAIQYIKKLTVESLPKVIYRGFFFDGDKLPKNFDKVWIVGNKPNLKLKKITSWTTSLSTAIAFTDPQDKIKNVEEGYGIVLKGYPTKKDTIADLRNFELNNFYSQMELIMDSEFLDYEVYLIQKGGKVSINKDIKTIDLHSGVLSITKKDILLKPFAYWNYKGLESERELLKTLIDKTPLEISKITDYKVEDFIADYTDTQFKKDLLNVNIAIGNFIKDVSNRKINLYEKSKNEISFKSILTNYDLFDLLDLKRFKIGFDDDLFEYDITANISEIYPNKINVSVTINSFDIIEQDNKELQVFLEKLDFYELFENYLVNRFSKYKIIHFSVK